MDIEHAYHDLCWVASSKSLIQHPAVTELLGEEHVKAVCDGNFFDEFRVYGEQHAFSGIHKVGLYFEWLVEFLIRHVLAANVIAQGKQIQEGGRTIGEADFIFEHAGDVWHVETAVKFYLALSKLHTSGSCLVGPNSRDNFEAKWNRLITHQLPLSERYFPDVTRRSAFVRGIIFYHRKAGEAASEEIETTPSELNSDHERGRWCYASDAADVLLDLNADAFSVRAKPHWLSNISNGVNVDRMDPEQTAVRVAQHFSSSDRPLMLSALANISGPICEMERVFVVADSWP